MKIILIVSVDMQCSELWPEKVAGSDEMAAQERLRCLVWLTREEGGEGGAASE